MGKGYCFKCNCGYEQKIYLGVGFCYPEVYAATIEDAKSGALGDEYKRLLKKNPDIAIDSSLVLMHCRKCNSLGSSKRLSLHLPKPGYNKSNGPKTRWSSTKAYYDIDYVSTGSLRENYCLLREYDHCCQKCGNKLELIEEHIILHSKLKCPVCKEVLKVSQNIMWD